MVSRTWSYPLYKIDINLTDYCNLSCQGCDRFSNLVEDKVLLDFNQYQKDLKELYRATEGQVGYIFFLGGEPFIHPEIEKFIAYTKEVFHETPLGIITNGILLKKVPDSVLLTLKKYDIHTQISRYLPLDFYTEIEERFKKLDMEHLYYLMVKDPDHLSAFTHTGLVPEGDRDPVHEYEECMYIGSCLQFKDGKIYGCPIIRSIENLNKYHGTEFEVTSNDYINVYDVTDKNQILEHLNNPYDFCRYCDSKYRKTSWYERLPSQKHISENLVPREFQTPIKPLVERIQEYIKDPFDFVEEETDVPSAEDILNIILGKIK